MVTPIKGKPPKVSVLIPTYNYARYLSQTIESVLAQNFDDMEILIVDDCSRDNTMEILEKYRRLDDRIRVFLNTSNLGMVNNWNRALSGRGSYQYLFGTTSAAEDAIDKWRPFSIRPSIVLVASMRTPSIPGPSPAGPSTPDGR
jgi:glycosyltransferase involved in cell wall biosynthesis